MESYSNSASDHPMRRNPTRTSLSVANLLSDLWTVMPAGLNHRRDFPRFPTLITMTSRASEPRRSRSYLQKSPMPRAAVCIITALTLRKGRRCKANRDSSRPSGATHDVSVLRLSRPDFFATKLTTRAGSGNKRANPTILRSLRLTALFRLPSVFPS